MGKHIKEKQGKEYGSLNSSHPESTSQQTPEEQNVEMELMNIYRRLLHKKVSTYVILSIKFLSKGGTETILHTKFS